MTHKMTGKQWLALAGIAVAAFVFNSSEFMPVGLLTDIGKTFGTNEATTGMLVSVYAWAVMLLSVPLMIIATRLDFRRLLLVVIVVFLVGQVLTSLSTSYWMLMAARMVVACAHSVFWAIAAPIAVRLVPKNKRALALSVVETGTAVAAIGLRFHQATSHKGRNNGIHRLLRRIQNIAQLFLGYPFWPVSNFFKHPHAKV